MKTDLDKYFTAQVVGKLISLFEIRSMGQLVSLSSRKDTLKGISEKIGLDEKEFFSIIDQAKCDFPIRPRSNRRYAFGAIPPKKKKRQFCLLPTL
jgi:hypothetical protein